MGRVTDLAVELGESQIASAEEECSTTRTGALYKVGGNGRTHSAMLAK